MIELLVCIAIVGILAGLLLPVASEARQYSADVHCRANLRQIGQAVLEYAQNNRDYWPLARPIPLPFPSLSVDPPLPEPIEDYIDVALGHKLYHCPRDREWIFNRCGMSYYYEPLLSGLQGVHSPAITFMGWDPPDVVMVGDYDNGDFEVEGTTIAVPAFHRRRNYVFADGHVGHVKTASP